MDLITTVAGEAGDRQLVSLTREELAALGDAPALVDSEDAAWWEGLDHEAQELVSATAQRGLLARNLILVDPEPELAPEVTLILAARRAPAWITALTDNGAEVDGRHIRLEFFGVEAESGPAALLCVRLDGIYLSRLLTGDAWLTVAAEWLARDPERAGEVRRTIEVLGPEGAARRRAIVVSTGDAWAFAEVDVTGPDGDGGTGVGGPQQVSVRELEGWLRDAVARSTS